MAKSPAFQFYVKDWLASTKVRLMTPEQRGGYADLLCHAWNEDDCSLPNDDRKLGVLSGLFDKWDDETSDAIKPCFDLQGSRLVHLRLLEEKKKQDDWREKCSEAGKKSAELRKTKGLEDKGSSTVVQLKGQLTGNSSVCSLQSSSASSPTSLKNTEKHIHVFEEIVSDLNRLLGTNYKHTTTKTQRLIKARLDEGPTADDFKQVHAIKHAEWNNTEYAKFLRPETLYGTKFESYLNQKTGTRYDPQASEKADMTKKEIARCQKSIDTRKHDLVYIDQLEEHELTDILRADAKRYRADIARDERAIKELEANL